MGLKIIDYIKNIQQIAKNNSEGTIRYGRNIIIGIVGGVSVVIIDRIVSLMVEGWKNVNIFSISSLISMLIYTMFDVLLMFFLVSYIIHKGLNDSKIKIK